MLLYKCELLLLICRYNGGCWNKLLYVWVEGSFYHFLLCADLHRGSCCHSGIHFGCKVSLELFYIVLYCIVFFVFIHFYSASHSMILSEALPIAAMTLSEFTRRSTTGNCK